MALPSHLSIPGREVLRVLVTDSGLGGLSVVARIEEHARTAGLWENLHLVFCNAQPAPGAGYNKMNSREQQLRVFDGALEGMWNYVRPDLILIACNTLSVLYPSTSFALRPPVPVTGIVESGVDLMHGYWNEQAAVLIFGTETTIASGVHRDLLRRRGVADERIVTRACPGLAGLIERHGCGRPVREAIRGFVAEASAGLSAQCRTVIAGLCCTHYAYCDGLFGEAFREAGFPETIVADPNAAMSSMLFPLDGPRTTRRTTVRVQVVSRMELTTEEIRAIGALLRTRSPMTADALEQYQLDASLFSFVPAMA